VLDPSGAPVSGTRLTIVPISSEMEVRSDAEGQYSITWQANTGARAGAAALPAVQYLLVGRDVEHNLAAAVEVNGQATNVDLHLQAGLTLSGSVKDPGGAPVTNAMIRIIMYAGNGAGAVSRQPTAAPDAKGAFSFSALPQGQLYNLSVTADGYGSANRRVPPAETQTASLQLETFTLAVANLSLRGQVLDAGDKPVPGVNVNMQGQGQLSHSTITDAKGRFVFEAVCAGPVQLFATSRNGANGGPSAFGSARAQGGDTNVVVKLAAMNAVPAPAPRANGQAPTNRPPPAPLQP